MNVLPKNEVGSYATQRRREDATWDQIASELNAMGAKGDGKKFTASSVRSTAMKDTEEERREVELLMKSVPLPPWAPDLKIVVGQVKNGILKAQKYARRRRSEGVSATVIAAEVAALGYQYDGRAPTPSAISTWCKGVALPAGRERVSRRATGVNPDGKTLTKAPATLREDEAVHDATVPPPPPPLRIAPPPPPALADDHPEWLKSFLKSDALQAAKLAALEVYNAEKSKVVRKVVLEKFQGHPVIAIREVDGNGKPLRPKPLFAIGKTKYKLLVEHFAEIQDLAKTAFGSH